MAWVFILLVCSSESKIIRTICTAYLIIYQYIYIYIVLKKSNRMHKFLFYMANRFHVKKQFSKPLNVAYTYTYIYIYIYIYIDLISVE